jgi:methylmalonyl-CoA/ethylmalonyl-CoA epimerase
MLTEVDHVAIAVHDLDAAIAYYENTFGVELAYREEVPSDGLEEAMLKVGHTYVQLLKPLRPDSPVGKFLEKRGEGIHHIAYRVPSVAAAIERINSDGGTVIDEVPRIGGGGHTVAFVHPKTAFGTLIELVEEYEEH